MMTVGVLVTRIAVIGVALLATTSCNRNQQTSADSFQVPLTVMNHCDRHLIVEGFGYMPRLGPLPELTAMPAPDDDLKLSRAVEIPPGEERVVNIVAMNPGWVVYLKLGSEHDWFAYYSKPWEAVEATRTISIPQEVCR